MADAAEENLDLHVARAGRTALDAKYISAPLTKEQIAELVQIPARGKK